MGASHTVPGAAEAAPPVETGTAAAPAAGTPTAALSAPPGSGSTPAWPFLAPIGLVALAAAIAIVRSRRTAARLSRE
jgi:hypothetical protein